jgi:hypothetical protein
MWVNDLQRNEISVLGLIASDFAYKKSVDIIFDKNDATRGEFLASVPDSRAEDEYSFSPTIVGLSAEPLAAAYATRAEDSGIGVVILPNWRVFNVIEQESTGFGAVIFRGVYFVAGQERTDYLVSFRGTDGRDGRDWLANIQLGLNQWRNAAENLAGTLQTLTNADGTSFSGTVHFAGQSLGGALAQYAAYAYASARGTAFRPEQITLTTFNAFAGGAGLLRTYGIDPDDGYNQKRLAGVSTAHYVITNDIVHALGAAFTGRQVLGHLNAQDGNTSNLFQFDDFRAFENGQPKTGERSFLSLVDAHRIESGFYAGMDRYQQSFLDANVLGDMSYVTCSRWAKCLPEYLAATGAATMCRRGRGSRLERWLRAS